MSPNRDSGQTIGFQFNHSSGAFCFLFSGSKKEKKKNTKVRQMPDNSIAHWCGSVESLARALRTGDKELSVNNRCSGSDTLRPRAKPELLCERWATDSWCRLQSTSTLPQTKTCTRTNWEETQEPRNIQEPINKTGRSSEATQWRYTNLAACFNIC